MKLRLAFAAAMALFCTNFASAAEPGKLFQRIIVVVLENTNYEEAMHQPFMSGLAKQGALLANFDAEAHPSQPNYIAMISGSTHGVTDDYNVDLDGRHVGDLLEEKGYDWRAYAEGFPGNCYLGSHTGKYARKHVPFLSFRNVQNNPARCAKIVRGSQFDADAAKGALTQLSFYVPDLNDDGHDTNAAFADNWLKGKFEKYLKDPAFMDGTLFVLTFDENDDALGDSRNQIFTAFYGPMVKTGSTVSDLVNHYSVLRLMEDNWSLDHLTRGDSEATQITGIWSNE